MKILLRLLSFLVIILFSIGCKERSVVLSQLDNIDSLIQEYPDSALELLQEIDVAELKEGEEKALYGLLKTMADDKNYLDPKNDTIILYASRYFNEKGDVIKGIKSDYYRGRVLYHKEDYPSALISFFKAKDVANKNNEYFWEGMSYRGISDIYAVTSNAADELIYAEKEFENIQKSGVQPYLNYSLLDLSRAYNNNGRDEDVIRISDQLADSARKYDDEYLMYMAHAEKARILSWQKKYADALIIWKEIINSSFATSQDSLFYAWNLAENGFQNKSIEIVGKVSNSPVPLDRFIMYSVYKSNGQYVEALNEMEKMFTQTDSILKKERSFNISNSLTEYYEMENQIREEKIKSQNFKIGFIISLSVLIVVILAYLISQLWRKYKLNEVKRLDLIEELNKTVRNNMESKSESSLIIQNLFQSQHKLLSELGEIIRENPQTNKAKRRIDEKIDSIINGISLSGGRLSDFEKQVDKVYNNLFSEFRNDLPNLKKEDYALFLYSIMDFSYSAISIFLGESSIESIYNRKRRLKNKIQALSTEKSQKYLVFL